MDRSSFMHARRGALNDRCFDRTKICVVMEEFCHDAISDRKRCDEGVKKCCENIVTQISSDL
uniref:WAP domain-containing protein n=1 Tax=Parascaris univalens TaxID=6257 RepID=A0A915B202_PARUN